jgi:hypothetical protein
MTTPTNARRHQGTELAETSVVFAFPTKNPKMDYTHHIPGGKVTAGS